MDPVTGLIALAGVSLASLAGLRLKKKTEGFAPIPYDKDHYPDNTDAAISSYPDSVNRSQSRYNMFTNLVNPLLNGIIPVASSDADIQAAKNKVNIALGSAEPSYKGDARTLKLQQFKNKFPARSDGNDSIFTAINFCRETGKLDRPFGVESDDKVLKFSEICGVCLSSGIDELGQKFTKPQGLLLDANSRDQAIQTQQQKGLIYPRVAPVLATCTGAPDQAVFAINQEDLDRYRSRLYCIQRKQIDPDHGCALCFEKDSYSFVRPNPDTTKMSIVLRGVGNASIKVKGSSIGTIMLSDTSQTVELVGAKEGNTFGVDITPSDSNPVTIFGYFEGINSGGDNYYMPLNLLFVVDDITGSSPKKSGGFYNFSDVGVDVAKMRAGSGQTKMSLRGTIPFTFVDPDEFSAMDCPSAPFQTRADSVSAFSADQPCYAKGSGPGKYNNDCLRSQILAVGCTNAGELYKNPGTLNTANGIAQSIDQIYNTLVGIADKDGLDTDASKQCSGRIIDSPCDPFLMKPNLKFAVAGPLAGKCLSYLYSNKGASEAGPVQKIGPTYSGVVTYANNKKEVKKIYCLPEGTLNPDTSSTALNTLIKVADEGYNGKFSIEAVRAYLNDQLETAVDMTRNANTDDDRKNAIKNCFGTNLNKLPLAATSSPKVVSNPCGISAQYVVVRPSQIIGDAWIQISQLVLIDKDGNNVAKGASASSSGSYSSESNPSKAIDGSMYPRSYPNIYHSNSADANSAYFKINLGKEYDLTKVIYYNRADCCSSRCYGMRVQFYDKDNTLVLEKQIRGYDQIQNIDLINPGSPATCKVNLNPPPQPVIPAGYKSGIFTRFYKINNPYPGTDPTSKNGGWIDRDTSMTAGPLGDIQIHDEYNGGTTSRPGDSFGVWAKGYYMATGPETIQFRTTSDDGIYVQFNGKAVISHWDLHGPSVDESGVISIPSAGLYAFDLRFYEWGGGAICKLEYRSSRSPNYSTALSADFVHNVNEETAIENQYQNELTAAKAAAAAAAAITYVDKGCWRDTWDRGLAWGGGYGYNVDSCFKLAKDNNSDKFSLQDGSQCFISSGSDNYKKWGAQGWCPQNGAGWNNHVFQIKKKAIMNGPWVGRDVPIANVDIDNAGNTVYMIEDDIYTKMVNTKGDARYYVGKMSQFNSNQWGSYSSAGNNYRVTLL